MISNNYTVYMHKNKINNKVYIGITRLPVEKDERRFQSSRFGIHRQLVIVIPKLWIT